LSSLLGHKYKDGKFEFTSIEELDEIFKIEVAFFLQQKVPLYSEKYSELESIYKLYTDPGEENYKLIHFGFETCIRTLIVGHVLFPEDFNKVINICESRMRAVKQRWPASFDVELFDTHFYNVASSLVASE
jgi:hypothetical protein